MCTPWKMNLEAENHLFEKEKSSSKPSFLGSTSSFSDEYMVLFHLTKWNTVAFLSSDDAPIPRGRGCSLDKCFSVMRCLDLKALRSVFLQRFRKSTADTSLSYIISLI